MLFYGIPTGKSKSRIHPFFDPHRDERPAPLPASVFTLNGSTKSTPERLAMRWSAPWTAICGATSE
jgi:hypothetical protein